MISLIKLHRKYLFNKINLIVIFLVIMLAIILSIVTLEPQLTRIETWIIRESIANNYEHIYLMFTKIIMVLFSCYLFTIHFNHKNDEYKYLLLNTVSKRKYYLTKILTLSIFIIMINLVLLINYMTIGTFFTSWFVIKIGIINNFFKIALVSLIYGLISLILTLLIKNIYSVLVSFGLYFVSEILIDFQSSKKFIKGVLVFLPTIDFSIIPSSDFLSSVTITFNFILLIILYYLISHLIYINSE